MTTDYIYFPLYHFLLDYNFHFILLFFPISLESHRHYALPAVKDSLLFMAYGNQLPFIIIKFNCLPVILPSFLYEKNKSFLHDVHKFSTDMFFSKIPMFNN